MTGPHLRELLRKQPFEHLKIRLSDGRALAVTHPDFVSLPPENVTSTFIVWQKDGSFDMVSMRQVTSVSSKGDAPTPRARRRRAEDDDE